MLCWGCPVGWLAACRVSPTRCQDHPPRVVTIRSVSMVSSRAVNLWFRDHRYLTTLLNEVNWKLSIRYFKIVVNILAFNQSFSVLLKWFDVVLHSHLWFLLQFWHLYMVCNISLGLTSLYSQKVWSPREAHFWKLKAPKSYYFQASLLFNDRKGFWVCLVFFF